MSHDISVNKRESIIQGYIDEFPIVARTGIDLPYKLWPFKSLYSR